MAMLRIQANAWDHNYIVYASHDPLAPEVLRFSKLDMEPGETPDATAWRLVRAKQIAADRERREAAERAREETFLARDDSSHLAWI